MWATLKTVVRRLLIAAGVLVIVLAIALGGFRFVAAQLPGYQRELQNWVAAELGLYLQFERLDMRLALRGPELSFYDVALASGDQQTPFIAAAAATVTLDPVALVWRRDVVAKRLEFAGMRLAIVRLADGSLHIDSAPVSVDGRLSFDFEIPREVDLSIRDSELIFEDRAQQAVWQFHELAIDVQRSDDAISMSARARAPESVAELMEISVDGDLGPNELLASTWQAFVSVRAANLGGIAALWPLAQLEGLAGFGNLSVWLSSSSGPIDAATVDMALTDVQLPASGTDDPFDRIDLTAEWNELDAGWQIAVNDVVVERAGRAWRRGGSSLLTWRGPRDGIDLRADFVRLEDLTPIVRLLTASPLRETWVSLDPRGDWRDLELSVAALDTDPDVAIAGSFEDFAFEPRAGAAGIGGLRGEIRADSRSGRLQLDSDSAQLDWPAYLVPSLDIDALSGVIVWREGRNAIRVVTDDLRFDLLGAEVNTSLEVTLPHDATGPRVDLISRVGAIDVLRLKPYIPESLLPESVFVWLDRAIEAGTVEHVDLSLFGALDEFPFDSGQGQFSLSADVSGGRLAYVAGWPVAEELTGTIEFTNAGFYASGSGRVLGNASRNIAVAIADFRSPLLAIQADTVGPLADLVQFLNEAPAIAAYLGPNFRRIAVPAGVAKVALDLGIPLRDIPSYVLASDLDIEGGELVVDGFRPHVTDIGGRLTLRDGQVSGEAIAATFLDGPILAFVQPTELANYRARVEVDGEVTANSVMRTFDLPLANLLAGQTMWHGTLELPREDDGSKAPVVITVDSNLTGIASKFPAPFAKSPGEQANLSLQFSFAADGELGVEGNLGVTRRFVADYRNVGERYDFVRGGLRFGGDAPRYPAGEGLLLEGVLPAIDLDRWADVLPDARTEGSLGTLAGVDVSFAELTALGQNLGETQLAATSTGDAWTIDVASQPIAGRMRVLHRAGVRPTITADMQRLHLQSGRTGRIDTVDPTRVPGLDLRIEDFVVGARRLGRFAADVRPTPQGVQLVSFSTQTDSFSASGSGAWLAGGTGDDTRLAFTLASTNVAGTLSQLGFEPIIEGERADLTASLHWDGGPRSTWLEHVSGDIGISVTDGSLLDIDPGAGRMVGLMSITALPRRLALDFRDVFNKGFAFDEIGGDFVIADGNAFTDNLKLSGPVAEIGVVGRTGLRDRDFSQQAVVTAEPSNMLPTVGGLIGGAGVGAALLIFTRIFKEPLRGIGRVSYCITGSWDDPVVERQSQEQLSEGQLCAELPPGQLVSGAEVQP